MGKLKRIIRKGKRSVKKMLMPFWHLFAKAINKIGNLFMNKNKALFISFGGKQYSDNPLAISKRLHELRPNTKIVWMFKEPKKFKNIVPKYVKRKKMNRISVLWHLSTSAVWVDNDMLVYRKFAEKNSKQLYIETWHGDRGLKRCFYDVSGYTRDMLFSINYEGYCDYFLCASKFSERVVRSMFRYEGNLLSVGYPRNDILFTNDKEKYKEIKSRIGVDENTKILLYAPTFRKADSKFYEKINLQSVVKALEKKYGVKWAVVFRMHHKFKREDFPNINAYDANEGFDMSELLYVSDMLITDYSSSFGDFALTKRPIILYAPDYKYYLNNDRGLHFDITKEPFLFAKTNKGMLQIIDGLTDEMAKKRSEEVLQMYGNLDDGHATDAVCKVILDKFNELNKKSYNKKT